MRPTRSNRMLRIAAPLVAVLLGGLLGGTPVQATGRGTCVRAELPWPVVLPDGTRHAAGLLRICYDRSYTPVAGLHRTFVDGDFVGMFISRRVQSEGPVPNQAPFMLFRRDVDERWRLQGYALPDGTGLVSYRLTDTSKSRRGGAREQRWVSDSGPPPQTPGRGWAVLLASGPH